MKIIALVVTYNRLKLLKENLQSLLNQQYLLQNIIIIDNNSNDGTDKYVKQLSQKNKFIIYKKLNMNIGGSGGFYEGIKESLKFDYDWLWIMDDDTIVKKDSLANLIKPIDNIKNIGFICSKVLWEDGQVHLMNLPQISPVTNYNLPFNKYGTYISINACSFVSVIIKKQAIIKIGLPYKEFFIWGDDIEYTSRIVDNQYIGIYNPYSVVIHKTKVNYNSDIVKDSRNNGWKYKYGIRNQLFIIRKKSKMKFLIKFLKNIIYLTFKILTKRKNSKIFYVKIVLKSTFASICFNPKVDKIK